MLKNHRPSTSDKPYWFIFNQFADSSLNIMVYCFAENHGMG
ncbi:hypothetical protein ACNKHV_11270 [Shigella flexneri]